MGERRVSLLHGCFPLRLNIGKRFLAELTGLTPLVNKPVEAADLQLPVSTGFVRLGPGQNFINQDFALSLDGLRMFFNALKPSLDDFVGFIAGVVKPLPHGVVWRAALVTCFPLLAHDTQRILLFSTTQRLGKQGFCLEHQFITDLIGSPTLPAFQLAG